MTIPAHIAERLSVPAIAAPMFLVSGPDLVVETCRGGIVGTFPALNQRTTPELNGVVSRVSPDVTTDQRTGQSYYTIRVQMPASEVARLGEVKLIPGMPVEAELVKQGREKP